MCIDTVIFVAYRYVPLKYFRKNVEFYSGKYIKNLRAVFQILFNNLSTFRDKVSRFFELNIYMSSDCVAICTLLQICIGTL